MGSERLGNSRWTSLGRAASDRRRVIILGYIIRGPIGGLAWHHLQYVAGLAKLGHEVWFMEDGDDFPSCYDPETNLVGDDPSYGMRFIAAAFERLGLPPRWCFYHASKNEWLGPAAGAALDLCRTADVVLNISAVNPLRPWFEAIPARVVIDTDPAFIQARGLTDPAFARLLRAHNSFFTFGENYGCASCRMPSDGLPWRPTRQPVLLDAWTAGRGPRQGPFTTVMQWDSYKTIDIGGMRLGMKSTSFQPFMTLPQRTGEALELALGSQTAPREDLRRLGWRIVDPLAVTRDPWTYQQYIAQSKAEFSVAKDGYVQTNSGWFSERSAVYLASGRPVVVQDTGFTNWLPSGRGVLAFRTPDEALAGLASVSDCYQEHCVAARDIAAAYFDSDSVLNRLIEEAGPL